MNRVIRIGTRKSALALAQAYLASEKIRQSVPGAVIELVTKDTLGDRILDRPLQSFGGKGVFVSEFEKALLEGTIDLAVHSAKDMPMELKPGLTIAAVMEREDPRDVLVTCSQTSFDSNKDFLVGTSSPRRQLLLYENRKEIEHIAGKGTEIRCETLRGNVPTRLEKLCQGLFDGVVLASAGLKRLGIKEGENYMFHYFDPCDFIPAGGQGIMALEAREGELSELLYSLIDHKETRLCFELERSILKKLGAGCHEPVGVFSSLEKEKMKVWGISRRKGNVKRIYLEGGVSQRELECLTELAGKGLM